MRRSQATIRAGAVVAGLCVAATIALRPQGWRNRSRPTSTIAPIPGATSSIPETAPRFSRDPEHLRTLWEHLQTHLGLDPFAEATPASNLDSASLVPSNLVITAIWRQHGKSLAVINGRIFPEDSELAPYQITRIGPHHAELTGPGGTIRLALSFPSRSTAETVPAAPPARSPRNGAHISSAVSTP